MKTLITVTLNKPTSRGASLEAALGEVADLSDDELVVLAHLLRSRFPERFVP